MATSWTSRVAILALLAAATGCVSAGPPPEASSRLTTGSLIEPATYQLASEERRLDCAQLGLLQQQSLTAAKTIPETARTERNAAPATVADLAGRLFGGPADGLPAARSFRQQRERIEALGVEMRARGCPGRAVGDDLDEIERQLAEPA